MSPFYLHVFTFCNNVIECVGTFLKVNKQILLPTRLLELYDGFNVV